jgi:hypothetical protein
MTEQTVTKYKLQLCALFCDFEFYLFKNMVNETNNIHLYCLNL